jgi:HPt (histidine-containing phosphotransfer) domain-containing protein
VFVVELVDAYLADAPQQVAAIRTALGEGDVEGLVRPAHTIKGSSLSLGGARVAEVARTIEERGRAGSLDGVDALVAHLDAASADLAGELARARARRWAAP